MLYILTKASKYTQCELRSTIARTVFINDLELDYVHTVSFSFAFYIVLRPQGIRKQMKTLRKRHRVHIALGATLETLDFTIHIGSTLTFLYFDLYLNITYAAHYVYYTYKCILGSTM